MPAPPGPRRSRAQDVAGRIEETLLAERTPVGSTLGRRTDLMARYEVSPTVMNESLRILRDRGLVEVRTGPGGGVFVASLPPHVRLGGLDLWFSGTGRDPLELFEARSHLEDLLTRVALDRATPEDLRDMDWALDEMERAPDAAGYLAANLRLHRVLARASRLAVLADVHEAIVTLIDAGLVRAVLVEGTDDLLRHNIDVHREIVSAVRHRDGEALDKALRLHHRDLVREDDPARSPGP